MAEAKSGGPIGHMAVKGQFDWLLGQVPSCQLKDVFVCRHVFVPSTCGITVLKDTTLVSTLGVVGTYGRSPKRERVFLGFESFRFRIKLRLKVRHIITAF